jgi:hypothetical protein
MVALAVLLSPELPPLSPLLVREAGSTLVVKGMTLLLVLVKCTVLPALTLVIVVTTSEIELLVINVLDAVNVLVTVEVESSEELVISELEEGVCVEVVVMTVTDSDEVGGRVMVAEVVMVDSDVVSLVTVTEVVVSSSLLVGVAVPESVVESVDELEPESPVVKATL